MTKADALARIAELTAALDDLERQRRKLAYERGYLRKSIVRTGRIMTPETRAKIAATKKGKKHTVEACENMRQAAQARAQRKRGMRVQDALEARIFGSRK